MSDFRLDLIAESSLMRMLDGRADTYENVLMDVAGQLPPGKRTLAREILDGVISYHESYRVTRIRGSRYIIKNNTQRERMKEEIEHREWFERVMKENDWVIEFDRFKLLVRQDRKRLGLLSNIAMEYGVYVVGGQWAAQKCTGGKMYQVGPFIDRTEMKRCRREIVAICMEGSCGSIEDLETILHDVAGFSWNSIYFAIQKECVREVETGKGIYRAILGQPDRDERDYIGD